jgi:hypothetical protein
LNTFAPAFFIVKVGPISMDMSAGAAAASSVREFDFACDSYRRKPEYSPKKKVDSIDEQRN